MQIKNSGSRSRGIPFTINPGDGMKPPWDPQQTNQVENKKANWKQRESRKCKEEEEKKYKADLGTWQYGSLESSYVMSFNVGSPDAGAESACEFNSPLKGNCYY